MSRTLAILPLLAALLVSCGDREPEAEPTVVEHPLDPDHPPAHLVEKYGPPPAGGPTGRRKTVDGIEFIELSPGYFLMGSDDPADENPRRWVEIPEPFAIAKTEVTNEQLERLAPERYRGPWSPRDNHPAVVSWLDARNLCERLAVVSDLPVRLPSEEEWEFACLAGRQAEESDERALLEHAWFRENAAGELKDVATRAPNAWGLHDMLGGASEWCTGSRIDPTTGVRFRPLRGGSFDSPSEALRASHRDFEQGDRASREAALVKSSLGFHRTSPGLGPDLFGFRPVAIIPETDHLVRLPTTAKVTSVSEEYHAVILSVGSEDGVEPGYEFVISRGEEYVGAVVIFRVERELSFGYSKKGVERLPIKVGDDAKKRF